MCLWSTICYLMLILFILTDNINIWTSSDSYYYFIHRRPTQLSSGIYFLTIYKGIHRGRDPMIAWCAYTVCILSEYIKFISTNFTRVSSITSGLILLPGYPLLHPGLYCYQGVLYYIRAYTVTRVSSITSALILLPGYPLLHPRLYCYQGVLYYIRACTVNYPFLPFALHESDTRKVVVCP